VKIRHTFVDHWGHELNEQQLNWLRTNRGPIIPTSTIVFFNVDGSSTVQYVLPSFVTGAGT